MSRKRRFTEEDTDPSSLLSNMFDIAMVFALALMVALVSKYNMTELLMQQDFTMIKNPGKDDMEIITKKGEKIERYKSSSQEDAKSKTRGKRVGVAYQLEDGTIVYQPE